LHGLGVLKYVRRVSGVSRVAITKGMGEINSDGHLIGEQTRCRKEGGRRKLIEIKNPIILNKIEEFLEPQTKGNPVNLLK